MKYIITFIMAAVALQVSAADNWIDSISLAPVGALKAEHLDGPSEWGAGLRLGWNVNPFVQISSTSLAFEGPGQTVVKTGKGQTKRDCERTVGPNSWGGSAIDETLFQVDSKISSFSTEKFGLHLVGGAQTDWNDHNWGVNVGAKLVLDFTKHFGAEGGYTIQTWFKGSTKVDSLVTMALNFRL